MIENLYFDIETKSILKDKDIKFDIMKFIKPTFYDTEEFHEYHKKFTDKVYRILFIDKNLYLGYCYVSLKDNLLKAPYSSPFSMIYMNAKYRIFDTCELIKSFIECSKLLNLEKIIITLPPEIYNKEIVNSQIASLYSNGFKVEKIDINHYFNLCNYINKEEYLRNLIPSARQNYYRALKNNLEFSEINIKDFNLAYEVIRINREQMGYPLKISVNQMYDLINMKSLTSRCFGVKNGDIFISAAIIFDVTDEISQVIYWGDISDYRKIRPMALLTTEIFDYYNNLGKKYLDIGPSSDEGLINIGLADFKKTIGCNNNIKITFKYEM